MTKTIVLILSLFCLSAFAADGSSVHEYCKIRKVWIDESSNRFWIQMADEKMDALPFKYGERYFNLDDLGEMRYKQYYALALLALAEELDVMVKCPDPYGSRRSTQLKIYSPKVNHTIQ